MGSYNSYGRKGRINRLRAELQVSTKRSDQLGDYPSAGGLLRTPTGRYSLGKIPRLVGIYICILHDIGLEGCGRADMIRRHLEQQEPSSYDTPNGRVRYPTQ